MNLEHTVDIGTDIASFFLFHPDDLARHRDDPLDWHDYDFSCGKEFEAGNLVAFRTGSDGGYQLRLTGGDLTDAERELATGSWEWGYTVRHGKVLVDNGNHLPSEEQFDLDDVPANQWVEIPNGDYRVTVYPIARKDKSLPDYVVRFEAIEKPLRIAQSAIPPDLVPLMDAPPKPGIGGSANDIYESKRQEKPLAETYPLLVVPAKSIAPGGSTSFEVTDDLYEAVQSDDETLLNAEGYVYLVVAPKEEVPTLAMLVWVNGYSQLMGNPGKLDMCGERLVNITRRSEGKLLPIAHVEPVTRPEAEPDAEEIQALQAAFEKYAEQHTTGKHKVRAFDRDRIAAITSGKALTTRLLELVPMPAEKQFALQAASDAERAKELLLLLKNAPL